MLNKTTVDNLRIIESIDAITPNTLIADYPSTTAAETTVIESRNSIHNILHGDDDRLIVICGPCSIHDPKAAIEYAEKLLALHDKYVAQLHIVMRVYFEKPRTTVGWKGLINDPKLNGSFDINLGLQTARSLLLEINSLGLSCGSEFLDLISPQYYADLISWGAIGARTTESQSHRELASGLSCPVGFKNGTNGDLQIATDAIRSSSQAHYFLSVTKEGKSAIFGTKGNEDCHVILRGGKKPNYDAKSIAEACALLKKSSLRQTLMVDMSHANSAKDHNRQMRVGEDIVAQISKGEHCISGVMIESNLVAGNQNINSDTPLVYGQSITDACIDFNQTEVLIESLAKGVDARRLINA